MSTDYRNLSRIIQGRKGRIEHQITGIWKGGLVFRACGTGNLERGPLQREIGLVEAGGRLEPGPHHTGCAGPGKRHRAEEEERSRVR